MEDILVNSILMTKRRRIPNSDACKSDLKEELCTLFKVYKEACSYNVIVYNSLVSF